MTTKSTGFLDKTMQGWVIKTSLKNAWRVGGDYDPEDLVQDAWLVYAKCRARYPGTKARHLMALFQRSFLNHIHDLCRAKKRQAEVYLAEAVPENEIDSVLGVELPEALALCKILENGLLAQVLRGLTTGDRRYTSTLRLRMDGTRETLNERWCRNLGLAEKVDLVGALKKILAPG